ncbi:MAG TPA: hypothetical protein VE732_01455 [Nitrososphaera sp.]|nr:hypothetical protein [Nitrososphaera sp.]
MKRITETLSLLIVTVCLLFIGAGNAYAQGQPGVVRFPENIDTQDSLLRAVDKKETLLATAITSTSTSIILLDASGFPPSGLLTIEGVTAAEKFTYTSRSGHTLNGVARGVGGTIAASHASGRRVRLAASSEYHNTLADSIIVTQIKIGSGASVADSGKFLKGTGAGASAWGDLLSADITTALGYTPLSSSLNLSDLLNAATARTNLGLGTAATRDAPASGDASAAQLVKGDDTRLTNSRTPLSHTHTETDLSFSDVTTNNANATRHGLLPKLSNDPSHCFRGDGSWLPCVAASSTFFAADGSAGSPGFSFASETSSGLYRSALNNVRMSIGGADVMNWSAGGVSVPSGKTLTLSGLTSNAFTYSGAGGLINSTAAPTNGQILIGSTGTAPALGSIAGTANRATVTNGAGSITIDIGSDVSTLSGNQTITGIKTFSTSPVIGDIAPSGDFSITQNSVKPIFSESTGAIVNTLYAEAGRVGINSNTPFATLHINPSTTYSGDASLGRGWFLSGTGTYTNTATAASGTVTKFAFNSYFRPTLAATNSSVTTTDAATVYIAGSVIAGTNMTLNRSFALWIDADDARFDGNVVIGDLSANATGATTGNFLYIPTSNGTPTGTPTTYSGKAALQWDATNKKLCIYDLGTASWHCTAAF